MLQEWPLLGRDRERALIHGVLRAHGAVLLAGPAGTGKTRLVADTVGVATEAGVAVLRLVASRPSQDVPFGAFSPILPAEIQRGTPPFVAARAAIDAAANGRPVVLLVDDAHWLDDQSAALVLQLVAHGAVGLLATVRSGGPVPEPVTALWKDGLVSRLDIGPLSPETTGELLAITLGGRCAPSLVKRFWDASAGNPLYLRELVMAAQEAGKFVEQADGWWLRGKLPVSGRLNELVAARLGVLSAEERHVLELLAIADPLDLDIALELADPVVVEDLEARGIVRVDSEGRSSTLRPGHVLYAEVARADMPDLRRRRLCRSLADAIEARGAQRTDPVRLARWRLDGGGEVSGELLRRAGRDASLSGQYALAYRFAEAAWRADGAIETLPLLAATMLMTGQIEARERMLDTMGQAAKGTVGARLAIARAVDSSIGRPRPEDSLRFLDDALAHLELDPETAIEVDAARIVVYWFAGRYTDAVAAYDALPTPLPTDRVVTMASYAALPLIGAGRVDEALRLARQAVALADQVGHELGTFRPVGVGAMLALSLAAVGQLVEATEVATAMVEVAAAKGEPVGLGIANNTLASIALDRGHIASAIRLSNDALLTLVGPLLLSNRRYTVTHIVVAKSLQGEVDLDIDIELVLDTTWRGPFDWGVGRARARRLATLGELAEAQQELREVAVEAASQGNHNGEAQVLHELARLGRPGDVVERLRALAVLMPGTWVDLLADHAAALAAGDAVALEVLSQQFEALGAVLLAGESASSAASHYADAGDLARSTRLLTRGNELLAQCGLGRAAAPVEEVGPVPLTDREREIATLAASGAPSKTIAERLYLSTRTVDNHLGRIYAKLGVSNRGELATVLGIKPAKT